MRISTRLSTTMLALAAAFFCSTTAMRADVVIEEDFEDVTLVDADGNDISGTWHWGDGLSNGWMVVDGNIWTSDGSVQYGLIKRSGKGYDDSNCYLENSYGSTNPASIFIPQPIYGDVMFAAKSNLDERSTKYTSKVIIYEATAEGEVTKNVLYERELPRGTNQWKLYICRIEDKYIAINLQRCHFDHFSVDNSSLPIPSAIGGIEETPRSQQPAYTLSGQRTATPAKGLYIVNGKKYIKK